MKEESVSEPVVLEIATTAQHFSEILALQKENLYSEISVEQQQQQGFVFAEHNLELLEKMADHLPQVIAISDHKVIGYNLAMAVSLRNELQSLVPMFDEFERCSYHNRKLTSYDYMVGGQVCVHQGFRGQGLLRQLYHETRNRIYESYELCVTEISARNVNSLKVHQKMGFEIIGTYRDEKELWHVVAWDLKKKNAIV
ncbi:GNAT family N-acetyltransferase [Pedobacter sp. PAMC26386]|nr:GNAT family N-acetyltransferase [Pedobacter sp. PAMC26386]